MFRCKLCLLVFTPTLVLARSCCISFLLYAHSRALVRRVGTWQELPATHDHRSVRALACVVLCRSDGLGLQLPALEGPANTYGSTNTPNARRGPQLPPEAKPEDTGKSHRPVKKHKFETIDWTFQSERYRLHREKQVRNSWTSPCLHVGLVAS